MNKSENTSFSRLLTYELRDVLRSRWAIGNVVLLLVITDVFFRFSGGGEQVVLSLVNVVLILVPLVSLLFGVSYLYNSREFTELMLAQPIRRKELFVAQFGALALPLIGGYLVALILPFAWHGALFEHGGPLFRLLVSGLLLTLAFLAIAQYISVRFDERVRGLGVALSLWLFFSVIYDGVVLLVAYSFSAYPLETPLLVLTALNPVSLARVLLLLSLDVAALLGYTGATFEQVFGGNLGTGVALLILVTWTVLPARWAYKRFLRKDF